MLCGQRARINEELGALLRAADLYERSSPTIAAGREYARRSSLEQLQRIFVNELGRLGPRPGARAAATIDALLTQATWRLLRTTHGLSVDEARVATAESIRLLLRA
jgi:hypothetical protein